MKYAIRMPYRIVMNDDSVHISHGYVTSTVDIPKGYEDKDIKSIVPLANYKGLITISFVLFGCDFVQSHPGTTVADMHRAGLTYTVVSA